MNLAASIPQALLPALVGAVGTGSAAAYLSSKNPSEDELPSERRKRILRNAMTAGALGGAAGLAVPAGAKLFKGNQSGGMSPWAPINSAFGVAADNPATTATAIIGGTWLNRARKADSAELLRQLSDKKFLETLMGDKASQKFIERLLKDNKIDTTDFTKLTPENIRAFMAKTSPKTGNPFSNQLLSYVVNRGVREGRAPAEIVQSVMDINDRLRGAGTGLNQRHLGKLFELNPLGDPRVTDLETPIRAGAKLHLEGNKSRLYGALRRGGEGWDKVLNFATNKMPGIDWLQKVSPKLQSKFLAGKAAPSLAAILKPGISRGTSGFTRGGRAALLAAAALAANRLLDR